MATVDFALGTPFASALQNVVQPKLAEFGWTTGDPEDSTIFEYILLMLGNNKNEAQIASELSNDLLDLGPDNIETQQFARWLFEQIDAMQQQLNGGANDASIHQSIETHVENASNHVGSGAQDTDMDGATDSSQGIIPTGPKAMRNGSGPKSARGGRMLNNLNKQMDNNDAALHRVRGSQGSGRINSHSREPPKGPRGANVGRGVAAMANGRGLGNVGMNMGPGGANGMNGMGMNQMGGMPPMPMPPMGQNSVPGMLNPQQQMALMQMYEQQAQMMQQIFSGQTPQPFVNPNFQQNRNKNGKFGDRNGSRQGGKQGLHPSSKFTKKEGQDETMADSAENGDSNTMEAEGSRSDPSTTLCNFNLRCTNPNCKFVHQSPAAPDGTPVDMEVTCTFGAACKNQKCVGKHPSPNQRQQLKTEQECAFYPNCRDMANCPYKHPSMPPCRNGADCTTLGCKFWHNTTMCKFNPCTNFHCPYKHVEGQKKTFKNKEWVAPKSGEGEKQDHVSERRFVDDDAEEELIIPGKANEDVEITT